MISDTSGLADRSKFDLYLEKLAKEDPSMYSDPNDSIEGLLDAMRSAVELRGITEWGWLPQTSRLQMLLDGYQSSHMRAGMTKPDAAQAAYLVFGDLSMIFVQLYSETRDPHLPGVYHAWKREVEQHQEMNSLTDPPSLSWPAEKDLPWNK